MTGSDRYASIVHAIPFLSADDGLYRKAADMVFAACALALRVEDHVVSAEAVKMQLLVKPNGGMVGQARKIHIVKYDFEHFCTYCFL